MKHTHLKSRKNNTTILIVRQYAYDTDGNGIIVANITDTKDIYDYIEADMFEMFQKNHDIDFSDYIYELWFYQYGHLANDTYYFDCDTHRFIDDRGIDDEVEFLNKYVEEALDRL